MALKWSIAATDLDFLGPPSVAVRILLEHLKVPYEFIYVKYYEGETLGDEFGQVCFDKLVEKLIKI